MVPWTRMFCATACWFISTLLLVTTAAYYLPEVKTAAISFVPLLLYIACLGVGAVAVIVGVLAFWLWVWLR